MVSLDLAADLKTVWAALVTDGGLEPWMGQGATIDPRPGGLLEVPDIVGGEPRHGLVHTVDEQAGLGFTWWPAQRPTERSDVSITLTLIETGTRITVTETPQLVAVPRQLPGFSIPASVSPRAEASALTGSLRGCWSWRLAVLALASQMARI